jgi:serine/threonine protein kinase
MNQPLPFGKYLLLERINVGGMAEVFKAKAFGVEGFERIIAVKRILPNMADDEEFINMFIDEARIAVQLNHANIVPIYELGKFDNQYYIAMEYVPGKDLRQMLDRYRKRDETMPLTMAAYITSNICEGLFYAHGKNDPTGRPLHLIHRDVSPQNILVSYEGAVKITDFGIAKAEDRASKTQAGVLKGKFAYMSPEQVRGLDIDHRSDLFAVGILLYEMVTGKRLFIGESDFATLEKVRNAEVTPPKEHNPNISDALQAVVLKALARERDERYQTAAELHDDLQQFLIQDNTVFTGKRFGEVLKEEYHEEIDIERQKVEAFLRLPPPNTQQQQLAQQVHLAAPTGDWAGEARGEKTVIFESGFADVAAPAGDASKPLPMTNTPSGANAAPAAGQRPTLPFGGAEAAQLIAQTRPRARFSRNRSILRLAFGAAAAMLVGVLALVWYAGGWTRADATGTLVVTSSPVTAVTVLLDDTSIGEKTPLTFSGVAAGEHRLVVRAPGYKDRAYRFDLVSGAPAEIRVELERDAVPGAEASLEVTSEPDGASIRMGGLPQGVTPTTLRNTDTAHPIILEVAKAGYASQTVTANFPAGERHHSVHVKLVAVGGAAGAPTPLPVDTTAAAADAPNRGRLAVRSRPLGASVYLAGVEKGITPCEIGGLDPTQTYAVELIRDGYRAYEETVHMRNRLAVGMLATLVPERRLPRMRAPAAGGTCQGTGAKLSVMALNVGDCKVTVGQQALGVSPMFKKDAPVGRCTIDVRCPGPKHYQVVRVLKAGVEEKIIIKPDDWE